ncbi:60 kDa SS-A/Ro ribonucleoprotein-like isoform X2 [Stegodyphus dumicola]|nr:60 kDa SS-A/Ro ribonucleoprotein-like isoform X2 [Stegodyphus dumicola]XP_035229491.1 60 kDa SS-A/Ro ribonucleoprotein-like isoform X2 [Stegodyphus dumicola]
MADSDPHIAQLRRYLYLGDETKPFPLSVRYPFNPEKNQFIEELETRETDKEAIQEILRIYREGHYLELEPIIYALAVYAHSKHFFMKDAAFNVAKEICSSAASMLTFAYFYKELSKPSSGYGRALRRFLTHWYNKKDAKDLAIEVTKVKSRHKWTHKDILCMAHVKSENTANAAVLKYAVKGFHVAEKECGSQAEAESVLSYLKGIYELTHTDDPKIAARLIEIHDLCLEHVPSKILKSSEVALCLIPRVPLKCLLELLPRFSKLGLLKLNSQHYKAVLERLSLEESLNDGSLDPLETFLVLRKWQIANRILPGKPILRQNTPALDDALQKLHLASFKTIIPKEKRYLIALDIRLSMNHIHCVGCSALTPSHVSDIILMALVKAEMSNVTVVVYSSGELVSVDINNKMTLGDVVEHLSSVTAGPVNLSAPIHWASEKKKCFDTFLVFTDLLGSTEDGDLLSVFRNYKENMNLPNTRYFLSTLCDKEASFPYKEASMLNVVGFNPKLIKIIQDFTCGIF